MLYPSSGKQPARQTIRLKEDMKMKLNKKIGVLALAGAMLTLTVCSAQAAGLKDGMKNGSVAGLKNGMTNGLAGGAKDGMKNGMVGGAKNGLTNGAKGGLQNSMANGLAGGAKDGMKNGMVGGMTNGLKNGLVNGFINGDIQQVLDIETLNRMLENGDLTQEEYDALIAAPESEE